MMVLYSVTVQMDIIFSRTKNFKKAKMGKTFHKVIDEAISGLKPNGNGPMKNQIHIEKCFIHNQGGIVFSWTLNLSISTLDDVTTKSLLELRRSIKKDFESWGKYHIKLQQMILLSAINK